MTEEGPPAVVTKRMEEALRSLANETRLRILQALLASEGRPLSFSELRDATGVADSGQFSYHLRRLTDQFVRRGDDGYELTYSGVALYHALLAGTPFDEVAPLSVTFGGACPDCAGPLALEYDQHTVTIACVDCEAVLHHMPFPVGGVEGREVPEILHAFDRRTRSLVFQAAGGVCPWCAGPMTQTLRLDPNAKDAGARGHQVKHACERCSGHLLTTVGEVLLTHPAVVSFYHDHGVDVDAVPMWELPFCVSDRAVAVESRDPVRLHVALEHGDDALVLVLDEQLAVRDSLTPAT